MAQAVIEQFEAVQIDMQQRQTAITTLTHPLMRLAEPFTEQRPVRQPGEFVVMGQVSHALFRFASCGEISKEADNMTDPSPRIANHIQLQPLWIHFTVFTGLYEFSLPTAMLLQRLMDGCVMTACVAAARQLDHVAPKNLLDVVTGHLTKGLVDREQRVLGVENHDAFAGCFKHRRCQLLLLFHGLADADVAARPDHTDHPAVCAALDRSPSVLDPDPMTRAMAHTVLDLIILAAPLQMLDQCSPQGRKVVGVQARLEVA
ncbi:hypothetical protein D3C81_1055870 [compost metagenome]